MQLPENGTAVDLEDLGDFLDGSVHLESLAEDAALDVGHDVLEGALVVDAVVGEKQLFILVAGHVPGQILDGERAVILGDHDAVHEVLELAHVAGP